MSEPTISSAGRRRVQNRDRLEAAIIQEAVQ